MSFMGEGSADCGPVNPMAGLMKQFGQDRSLQQVKKKKIYILIS
jgi:peroxin-5